MWVYWYFHSIFLYEMMYITNAYTPIQVAIYFPCHFWNSLQSKQMMEPTTLLLFVVTIFFFMFIGLRSLHHILVPFECIEKDQYKSIKKTSSKAFMTYVAFGNNEATNICFFLYSWLTHFYLCLLISTTQRESSQTSKLLWRGIQTINSSTRRKKNPNDFDASSKRLWYRLLCAFFVQIVYICSSEKTFVSPTTHTHICMNVPSKQTETHFKLTSPAIQKYTTCLRRIWSSCAGIN